MPLVCSHELEVDVTVSLCAEAIMLHDKAISHAKALFIYKFLSF
jgi:hypothetical protein